MSQQSRHSTQSPREQTCAPPRAAAPVLLERARLRPDKGGSDDWIRALCGHPSGNCGYELARLNVSDAKWDPQAQVFLPRGFVEREDGFGQWELGKRAQRNDAWARRNLLNYDPRRPYHEPRRRQMLLDSDGRVRRGKRGAWVVEEWVHDGPTARAGMVPFSAAAVLAEHGESPGIILDLYQALLSPRALPVGAVGSGAL